MVDAIEEELRPVLPYGYMFSVRIETWKDSPFQSSMNFIAKKPQLFACD
jgi:hypothetical protein